MKQIWSLVLAATLWSLWLSRTVISLCLIIKWIKRRTFVHDIRAVKEMVGGTGHN